MSARGSVVGRARVVLDVDKRRYDRGMHDAEQRAHRTGRALGASLKAGAVVGAAALTGLGVAAFKSTQAASQLGEQINKSNAVFREGAKEVQAFAKTAADSFGISNRAALEATGTLGNMLVPMGFARKGAAHMSIEMVKLAADMASFNDASPEETLDAIRAGFAGESEPLRRYGVLLNEAKLKEEALRLGLYNGKGALDAKAKATATYSLILKETKDQQGDFAATSGSLANQARILNARIANLSEQFGKQLLPALTAVAGVLIRVIDYTSRHSSAAKVLAGVVGGLSAVLLVAAGAWKAYSATQAIAAAFTTATNATLIAQKVLLASSIVGALILVGTALVIAYKRSETFRNVLTAVFDAVSKAVRSAISFIITALDKFLGAISSLARALSVIPGIGDAFAGVADKIDRFRGKLRKARDELNGLDGKKIKIEADVKINVVGAPAGPRGPLPDGIVGAVGDGVRYWAARNPGALMPPASATGSAAGLKPMILDDLALGRSMGLGLSSGYRPGSITSMGHPSLHGAGQAIDMVGSDAQMRRYAYAEAGRPGVAEVIYSPIGWSHGGSGFSSITDAQVKRDHYSHVHVGVRSGDGLVGAFNKWIGDGKVGKKKKPKMHKGGRSPAERKAVAHVVGQEELPANLRLEISNAKLAGDDKALLAALKKTEKWYVRHVGIARNVELKIRLTDALAGVRDEIAALEAGGGPTGELSAELQERLFFAEDTPGTEDDVTALEEAEQFLLGQLALATSAEQRLPIRQALRDIRARLTEARGQTLEARTAAEAPLAQAALLSLDREFGGNLSPIGAGAGIAGRRAGGGVEQAGGSPSYVVHNNQYFNKPPDDPHPLLRSAKFAAEAVFG